MIRNYQPSDLEVIMDIANRAWREIRRYSRQALGDRISGLLHTAGDDASKGLEVKTWIENNPDCVRVCEENGRIVGFITFRMGCGSCIGEIMNNAADPECGMKGIGQQMYRDVLDLFRANGMKAARVVTGLDDAHAPARRAYERAGFDRSLRFITYYKELE
jgi:ribosomal protein S18 acetylase RimI-like enzyme